MSIHECPKCGEPMERLDDESDVGIVGGWFCNACDHAEIADDDDDLEYSP